MTFLVDSPWVVEPLDVTGGDAVGSVSSDSRKNPSRKEVYFENLTQTGVCVYFTPGFRDRSKLKFLERDF